MSLLPEVLYLVDGGTNNNSALEGEQKTVSSESSGTARYLSNRLTPRNRSSRNQQRASFQEIRLPSIDLNNSLNVQVQGPNRPRTATLDYPKVLHTPPLQRSKATSALSETCHFCGKKFGSASIVIHEKQCQKKLLLKHNNSNTRNKNTKVSNPTPQSLPLQGPQHSDTAKETKTMSSWEPFSSVCRYCGVKFGTHSIAIHEKKCKYKSNAANDESNHHGRMSLETNSSTDSTCINRGKIVARVVTVGLEPGKIEILHFYAKPSPPSNHYPAFRPKTRSLDQSALRSSRIKLPSASSLALKHNPPSKTTPCVNCGESVSPDRITVHSRICKKSNSTPSATKGVSVTLPSLHNLLKTDQDVQPEQPEKGTTRKKPRTVVCYICGREYGTKSIAIHEPQCMRKWEAENRKLPIRERKPLPKKKEELSKLTCVAQASRDSERPIRPLTTNDGGGVGDGDIGDAIMHRFFQHCYSEFEKDLIPCKKCGRTFAPERHVLHEPNCNAKPLSSTRLKR